MFPPTLHLRQSRLFLSRSQNFFHSLPISQLQNHLYILDVCYSITCPSPIPGTNVCIKFLFASLTDYHKLGGLKKSSICCLRVQKVRNLKRISLGKIKALEGLHCVPETPGRIWVFFSPFLASTGCPPSKAHDPSFLTSHPPGTQFSDFH